MIEVKNLSKSFGTRKILDGVNLSIENSTSLVILGRSGSGKSVLIKNMVGLMQPDSGQVVFDKVNIFNLHDTERFSLLSKFGFLFQHGALFDSITVLENIVFYLNNNNEGVQSSLKQSQKKEIAASKLKQVGLNPDILSSYPSELSGGMQKRVALARAICNSPSVIFLDEPTTGLDPVMSNVINETIIRIREELGATTVIITHDIHSAKMIATDMAFLYEGKILWKGSSNNIDHSGNEIVDQFITGSLSGPIPLI